MPLKRIKDYMHSKGFAIEPIVYVRSPYSYRVSLYQSFLKEVRDFIGVNVLCRDVFLAKIKVKMSRQGAAYIPECFMFSVIGTGKCLRKKVDSS